MEPNKTDKLGKRIAEIQDKSIERSEAFSNDFNTVRQRLFEEDSNTTPQSSSIFPLWKPIMVFAATAILFVSIGLLWATSSNDQNSIQTKTAKNWFTVETGKTKKINFKNNSVVTISNGATARILEQNDNKVRLVIEQGNAHLNVKHFKDTNWSVEVGPYNVKVIGTVFEVLWEPATQHFRLTLEKGEVIVTGPMIESGRSISKSETFDAWVSQGKVEINSNELKDKTELSNKQLTDTNSISEKKPNHIKKNNVELARSKKTNSKPVLNKDPQTLSEDTIEEQVTWTTLVRNGQFAQVVDQAKAIGLPMVWKNNSAADIQALADAARLTKNLRISWDAFMAIRNRFPGTSKSAHAAYSLGKIAFDKGQSYKLASTWLQTYLKEKPSGALAREARGRLIEAKNKSGNISGAKKDAAIYLKLYPDGPHAKLAKSIL